MPTSSDGGAIALWDENGGEIPLAASFPLGPGSPGLPDSVFIEALSEGEVTLEMRLVDPSGQTIASDEFAMALPRVEIVRAGFGKVTSKKSTVIVGEEVHLLGNVYKLVVDKSNRSWQIPGNKVANYEIIYDPNAPATTSGTVTPLTVLDGPAVKYYWIDGGQDRVVSFNITLNGQAITRKTTFDVLRPHKAGDPSQPVTAWTETSEVGIHPRVFPGGELFPNALEFGNSDLTNVTQNSSHSGIQFHFDSNDEFFGGSVKWLQIGEQYHDYDGDSHSFRTEHRGLDGDFPWTNLFGGVWDTPGTSLREIDRFVQVDGNFQMFLMYKPASGGIWVPLVSVSWGWGAAASSNDGFDWCFIDHSVSHSVDPSFKQAFDHPVWTTHTSTKIVSQNNQGTGE